VYALCDDVVLVDKTRAEVNGKLEWWKDSLDSKVPKLSRTKIEYMIVVNIAPLDHSLLFGGLNDNIIIGINGVSSM
jgi:hypothetical protein